MSDYLWDKTGEAEEDVERLEELLGTLRFQPRTFEVPAIMPVAPRRTLARHTFTWSRLAVAASLLLMLLAGAWLAMITRNRAMDFHRRSRETTEVEETHAQTRATQGEAVEVLNLIKLLPEAYREPMILRFVEGMTGPEIAERTGLAPASVRVNIHRGVKMLREKLSATGRSV